MRKMSNNFTKIPSNAPLGGKNLEGQKFRHKSTCFLTALANRPAGARSQIVGVAPITESTLILLYAKNNLQTQPTSSHSAAK